MKKIILNLAVSLDGLIEGPNGEYDWCFTDQDYGITEFLNKIDTIFFGRKSYEVLINTVKDPYPDKKKCVFSNSINKSDKFDVINNEDVASIKKIINQSGKDIWLFGGAKLTCWLINQNLVDEMILSIHPIILGKGKPLFNEVEKRIHWEVTGTNVFPSGLVQIFYKRL
jgi:dihydrofolate reductase